MTPHTPHITMPYSWAFVRFVHGRCVLRRYEDGDVTHPRLHGHGGPAIILHCVNNTGEWGRGGLFAALDRRCVGSPLLLSTVLPRHSLTGVTAL